MKARDYGTKIVIVALIAITAGAHSQANATFLYSQDFESTTPGVVGSPTGSGINTSALNLLVGWEYTATGGANSTKGLTASFDGTGNSVAGSIFVQKPTASDASPLGNGSMILLSPIEFSIDLKPVGNLNPDALKITVSQTDPNYEGDRGIDANGDGDMTDSAIIPFHFHADGR